MISSSRHENQSLHFQGIGKVAFNQEDRTKLTFTSSEFIREVFDGVLMIRLLSGAFKGQENQMLERLLTGDNVDPYVTISVLEKSNKERIIDTAISSVKVP